MVPSVDEYDGSARKQDSNRALPVPAAQIELPPSPTQSVHLDVVDVAYNPSPASDTRLKQDSESWKAVCEEIDKYDQDMVRKWKDDLDMLLLFGGLFSVVVTSFTVESYKWLVKDPEETTVTLLNQISQQLRDPNATVTSPSSNAFHPQPSVLINFFWFLSLTLALTSGLFALLCEQWLREHMRETAAYTRTTAESLALRQLRRDSLEKWRVPQIIALTPILLQAALLLFFAGIIVLAWSLNLALFIVCFVICGLGAAFYFGTTVLPFLAEISADVRQKSGEALSFRFISPYKSPQAWAVYRFSCMIIRQFPLIGPFLAKRGYNWRMAVKPARDWSFSDMRVLTAFDLNPPPLNLNVYELRALDWAARMLQHSSSMVPHLKNIFSSLSLHPSVVMAGILNYWTLAIWEEFTPEDVRKELEDTTEFQETKRQGLGWYMTVSRAPSIPDPILHSKAGIQMLLFYQYWFNLVDTITVQSVRDLDDSISHFRELGLPKAINLRFFVPFPIASKLWSHVDPSIRQESLSLIEHYRYGWDGYPGPEEKGDERLAFIAALIKHLQQDRGGYRSILLTSDQGIDFICDIHRVIRDRLCEPPDWESDSNHRSVLIREWVAAIWSIIQIRNLPDIPGYTPPLAPPERSLPSKGPPRAEGLPAEGPPPSDHPPYPHMTNGDTYNVLNLRKTTYGDAHDSHATHGDIHGTFTTNGNTYDTCVTHGDIRGTYTTNGNTHDTYVTHGDSHSTYATYGDTFNTYTTHGERCSHNRYTIDTLSLTIVNNHWGSMDGMDENDQADTLNGARQEDAGGGTGDSGADERV
ncbi:hypothetical protein Moror_13093 [Moniliophthora roreri MCA 2997]|uniref:DUF6535 domain-containing protein n=2 Tax=Moniliophthora roreri TaxID=221103 RepID=V2X3Y2_MONRO|nr:hypothetical protein Moror_13093 [Moniliophthora roreri MCA 2997]KAI3604510.1 hypothetical protein WG66_008255 [Moniliophthora roreri]